jgi:hypothetical protein
MYSEQRSCAGKIGYDSRANARIALRRWREQAPLNGHLEAYACDYCAFWHIGHKPLKGKQLKTIQAQSLKAQSLKRKGALRHE